MVFLVFLEVLEMSSEVVGPGPNTREIKSLRVDPGPLACVQGHQHTTTTPPITLLWWRQHHAHQLRGHQHRVLGLF